MLGTSGAKRYLLVVSLALMPLLGAAPKSLAASPGAVPSGLFPDASGVPHPKPDLDDGADWLELHSGEWLKGAIKTMVNGRLTFKSQDLGEQSMGWYDVKQIYSPRQMNVLLDDRTTVVGRITVSDGYIVIRTYTDEIRVPFSDVVVLVADTASEWDNWHLGAQLGFVYQAGNTPQIGYMGVVSVVRQDVQTRLSLEYRGLFGQNFSQVTNNVQQAVVFFDHYMSSLLFLRLVGARFYFSPFQNLASQITVGTGVGLEIFRFPRLQWELVGGPAYQLTTFDTVQPGEPGSTGSPAFALTSIFEAQPLSILKTTFKYDITISDELSGLATSLMLVELGFAAASNLETTISFVWDRIQSPMTQADGQVPKRDDYGVIFGLGVDY